MASSYSSRSANLGTAERQRLFPLIALDSPPPSPGIIGVAAGDAEERFLTKSKRLLEEKKKLDFFVRHGIVENREAIWQLVKRFDTVAASVHRRFGKLKLSSRSLQTSLLPSDKRTWMFVPNSIGSKER